MPRASVECRWEGALRPRVHPNPTATMTTAEPRVPSLVLDQPALSTLARELAENERLREFVAAPAPARISEPLLPLFLAAAFLGRGGPLVTLFPDDAEARDAAEAAGWFLGEENVGLFASRGVRWGSGLEPPPHPVGERARALEVLGADGLVCASAIGAVEGVPPAEARPRAIRLRKGD